MKEVLIVVHTFGWLLVGLILLLLGYASSLVFSPWRPGEYGRLATLIMDEIPGEPSRDERMVDAAIRLLRAAYVTGEPADTCVDCGAKEGPGAVFLSAVERETGRVRAICLSCMKEAGKRKALASRFSNFTPCMACGVEGSGGSVDGDGRTCWPCVDAANAPSAPRTEPLIEAPPAPPDLDLRPDRCAILPHATPKPGPLVIDLHSAVLAVLQRPSYRDAGIDLRDPMDVITLRREGPAGPTFATVIRWYVAGERPIEELTVAEELDELPPLDAAAVPRMDGGVSYIKDPPRAE